MKIDLEQGVKEELQNRLVDYLNRHNIEIRSNGSRVFSCINPKHRDSIPSASIIPGTSEREWKCFGCLDANELIWTPAGLIPIKDVRLNLPVLGSDGYWHPITAIQLKEKPVYSLSTALFRNDPLLLTPDHKCTFISADDLLYALPYLSRANDRPGPKFYSTLKNNKRCSRTKERIANLELAITHAENLKDGDYFVFPVIQENRIAPFFMGKMIDEEIAWLIGIYLAEGSTGSRSVRWTLHYNEHFRFGERIINILQNKFGLRARKYLYPRKNVCEIVLSSVKFRSAITALVGTTAHNKRIPYYAMSWAQSLQAALLTGHYDGDGSRARLSTATTSRQLAYGLFGLAIQAEIIPSLSHKSEYTDRNGQFHNKSWRVSYRNLESRNGFWETINGTKYLFTPIKIDKTKKDPRPVIDITVKDVNTFTTKLGLTHNCGAHGDIFTAAHYLENKPLEGPGFVEENVLHLANLYQIKVPKSEMTEEEARRWQARRAYRIAAQYMYDNKNLTSKGLFELSKRKWPLERIKELGVGQIPDYDKFREFMLGQDGMNAAFLEQIDLLGPRAEWMFQANRLLFVLLDHHGRPCGFAARNLDYIKEQDGVKEPTGPKYKNTSSVGLYEKKKLVYNLHVAKKFVDDRIFILEGYADVVAARLAASDNCVALGGVHLTDDHIMLMRQLGVTHMVLALDGDDTGITKTASMIDKLSDYPGIKVEVLRLPPDEQLKDVDAFIRVNGEKAWRDAQLTTISSFSWQLKNRPHFEERNITLEKAIKTIVQIQSPFQVYSMCEELAQELDTPLEVIREEVKARQDLGEAQRKAEIIAFGENIQKQIQRRPGDLESIITHASHHISSLSKRPKFDPLDPAEQVNKCMQHIKAEDDVAAESGILLGWPEFDKKMFGIPPNDTWIVLGGKANAGKTSMCANMVYNAIKENDDLITIVYTIDDSYRRFLPRLISLHTGIPTSWVSKRKLIEQNHPGTVKKVRQGYDHIMDLMRSGRLTIWDIRDATTWAFVNTQLGRIRNDHPTSKILMILDNFHLLQDFSEIGDSPQKYARLSNMVANTVKEHEIALISTVEYHKLLKRMRPENQSIHQTQQLEYDSHLILHLINYEDEFGPDSKLFWHSSVDLETSYREDGTRERVPKRKPIVELAVGKSKLEEFKGKIFFQFDPARCRFEECSDTDQQTYRTTWHNWITRKAQ